MKSKLVFSFLVFQLLSSCLIAQSIPNGNFETWTSHFLYEEPAIYTSSNGQAFLQGVPLPITKSNDKVSGNYAVKVETKTSGHDTIPGFLILGSPGNMTVAGGYPFTARPDSMSFFAKYNEMPGDTGAIILFFKKNGVAIGFMRMIFTGTQTSYKKFTSPIFWFSSQIPDTTAAIIASSNLDGKKIPGSNLYLDSLITFDTLGTKFPYPNGNFENWISYNSEDPDGWSSLNFLTTGKPMLSKTSDKQNGTFAARIENVPTRFGSIAGLISNGRIGQGDEPTGGMAVSQNPLKVTGYYKYIPNGLDTAIGGIFLYRYDATSMKNILIEDTLIKLKPAANYTYFEIPIVYNGKPLADTLNISFAASNIDDTTAIVGMGSVLFIDNLSITYKPNSIPKPELNESVTWNPNPFNAKTTLVIHNLNLLSTNSQIVFYNCLGQEVMKMEITGSQTEIGREGLAPGIYLYYIRSDSGNSLATGRIMIY